MKNPTQVAFGMCSQIFMLLKTNFDIRGGFELAFLSVQKKAENNYKQWSKNGILKVKKQRV